MSPRGILQTLGPRSGAARLIMPVLEDRNDVPATDDLDEVLDKLEVQMLAQLMKAAASLHATNAVK
jgi:hypothetical protein